MRLDDQVARIHRTRVIAASPGAVWDALADFGAISSWAGNVDHSCLLEHGAAGPAVGTTRRVQVGRDALVERITEFTPPAVLAYRIEGLPGRAGRVGNRWTLEPSGTGTAVSLTSVVRAGGNPLARVAEHALCRMMARQSEHMLTGLAARLEGSP